MKLKIKKTTLDIKKALLNILILSLFLSVFQILMQIGNSGIMSFLDAFNPVIIVINTSIYFLFTAFLFFLSGKVNVSFLITSIISYILLVINHFKIYFLSVPLKAGDLVLGKETVGILGNYKLTVDIKLIILTIVLALVLIYVCKYKHTKKIKLLTRLTGVLTVGVISVLSAFYIYLNVPLYDKLLYFSNEFSDIDVANGHGFMYSFVNGISKSTYIKPENYDKNKVLEILKKDESEEENIPNVIAVMSEAFFDIREAKNIEFNENPLPNYTKLKMEGIYGDIIVPGFAGSTASTEFEFLTGVNISLVDKGMPAPYKTFLTKKAYGLPDYFNSKNFKTVAIHPGNNWFYNRMVAYKSLGFDEMIFLEDWQYKTKMTNYYTNDSETSKKIIENYSEHLKNNYDEGYFNFTVTIQNHGPYMDYDAGKEPIVKRTDKMDDKCFYTLDNYVQGLKDADNFLKEIKDYIETVDKPTVVVFFGDHLPFLDSELLYYDLIGYDITSGMEGSVQRKYKTPYLIFSNYAFKKEQIDNGKNVLKGKRTIISSNYLSSELLRYMNVNMPEYFKYLYDLKQDINVISPHYYMVKNKFSYELSDELLDKIKILKDLQYYNIMEYKK